MACFKIGNIIPLVGNIKAGSNNVIRIMNGSVQVWPCVPASIICGTWNSITSEEYQPSGTGSWAYDADGNEYWAEDPGAYYQILKITGGSQFDFYKLFLPGEIIDTVSSTARVLSYTTEAYTNLIANASELPTPHPQWEGVLYETTDTNTIYKYILASNTWVPVPYGQETTTYNVDGFYNWSFNFDYTPPYIGTLGDPTLPPPENNQGNNIHPVLTMTLGGNLVTTGGRVIPINETSTYTSLLQERESESTGCQNFRPTITGNICGTWSSGMHPMSGWWENITSGTVDFSSVLNSGELISTVGGLTNIQLNSYKTIPSIGEPDGTTYSTENVYITAFDQTNIAEIGGFFERQELNDDKPVHTLYFTGTIYTDQGRILNVNVTSQYGVYQPDTSGGGTSYAQSC